MNIGSALRVFLLVKCLGPLAVCLCMTWLTWSYLSNVTVGSATVVDGDTVRVSEQEIDLAGIDAPELTQPCGASAQWQCGVQAQQLLTRTADGRVVMCLAKAYVYGRAHAVCYAGLTDVAREIVHEGLAVTTGARGVRYAREEQSAIRAARGIWSGPFQAPALWALHANERTSQSTRQ